MKRFHTDESNALSSVSTRASPCLEPLEPLESSLAKVNMYLKNYVQQKVSLQMSQRQVDVVGRRLM